MDFLNKSFEQLSDLFRSMTPAARLVAILLMVAIIVSMAYLFRAQGSVGDEYLFGGQQFTPRELGQMEMAVSKAGLKGARIEGLRMLIPRGQKDSYLKALKEHDGVPDSMRSFASDAIEKDSPWSTKDQRHSAQKNAKERELSRIIKEIRGYEDAYVQYDETDSGGLSRTRERSALVAVKAHGNRSLGEDEVQAIRAAMQSALTGLKPARISVLDLNSGDTYTGSDSGQGSQGENVYLATKRIYERQYKAKLQERLVKYFPGVWVGVNVEMDPETYTNTRSTELKGKPVATNRQTLEKETPIPQNSNGGRPDAALNSLGNSPQQLQVPLPSERATETRVQEQFVNAQQQVESHKTGLVPTRITASIDVPQSLLAKFWRLANPTAGKDDAPPPAELKKLESDSKKRIESAVSGLLPATAGSDGKPLIYIEFVPDLPSEPLVKPSTAETATTWLAGNWQTLAMIGLAFVGMVFLKGLVRSATSEPAPTTEAAIPEVASASGPQLKVVSPPEEGQQDEKGKVKRTFKGSGPNLREELADLVKEDPDTAANILRSWIGDVA